jgi:hypothetical protein
LDDALEAEETGTLLEDEDEDVETAGGPDTIWKCVLATGSATHVRPSSFKRKCSDAEGPLWA